MSSGSTEGAFSASGPVVYLAARPEDVARLQQLPVGPPRRWLHATTWEAAWQIARWGLLPSCWRAGDCCAVCGVETAADAHAHHGDTLVEIVSPALGGQVKAWWVPASAVQGAWRQGRFHPAADLAAHAGPPPDPRGCACELDCLVQAEIAAWRSIHGAWRANPGSYSGKATTPRGPR